MNDESEILVQRILGLLGYTEEYWQKIGMEETLKDAYQTIKLQKAQAEVGYAFTQTIAAIEHYVKHNQ